MVDIYGRVMDMTTATATHRTNLSGVPEHVANRVNFTCNNTLCGRNGYAAIYFGRLPQEFRGAYDAARFTSDFYVIHSYATPIAWFANGVWTVPAVKYSVTTSRHQTQVRRGIA